MNSYWLTFKNRAAGCIEADTEAEARRIALEKTGHEAMTCATIPYPAEPRINKVERTYSGETYVAPSFCYDPQHCKGKTSCPKRYACSE